MKKSYALSLAIIVILLTITLSLTTSYGLWKITESNDSIATNLNGCFELIIPNDDAISKTKFRPLNEENGKASEPFSLSIKNNCEIEKKAEVRLNIKEDNTMNIKGLTVYVQGDIEEGPIKYNELKNSRADMTGLSHSKKVTNIDIEPGETIRLNIKLWMDEKVISTIKNEEVLSAEFAITDKESINLPTFKETILENNGNETTILAKQTPDYSNVATTDEGLFATEDEDGISYYFRGNVVNNYVSFANLTWRIVRINGDETIRLILQDTLEESAFNEINNDSIYAGFAYPEGNVIKSSTMKDYLDIWYANTIKNFDNYVAIANYCNDTNNYINNWHNYYQASSRLVGDKEPIIACETSTENYGGRYRNRVGLITADEVSLAGGTYRLPNTSYYLNNNTEFFTMTPRDYYYKKTSMFVVKANGSLEESSSSNKKGVRPVISLKANTVVIGDGTIDNPYRIDEDANK
ncbi:MAG: hypothetical protein ACI31M_02120 [Bacilli bacterium]